MNYPRIISEFFDGIWMINPAKANAYIPLISKIIKGELQAGEDYSEARRLSHLVSFASLNDGAYEISEQGFAVPPEEAPANSIAIINITDIITKYDQACGPAGMVTKVDILERCYQNQNIKAIILKIESPGGEVMAAMLMQNKIREKNKPVVAFIDDVGASAGYYIASPCDSVIANSNLAQVGSIGTYVTITDFTEQLKMEGIKLIEVYADASVDKNKDYHDALKGDLSGIKEKVNKFNDQFLADIKTNRAGLLGKDKEWNTGKIFFADEALSIGLIDSIGSFDQLIIDLLNN